MRQPVLSQTAERGHGNVFDILRFQGTAKRVAIELRVMARTRHCADVREAGNAIGVQQDDKFLHRQRRMTDRENGPVRPLGFLRRRLLAHDTSTKNISLEFNS